MGEKIKSYVQEYYPKIKKFYPPWRQNGFRDKLMILSTSYNQGDEVIIQLGDSILDMDYQVISNSRHSTLQWEKFPILAILVW